MCSQCLILLNWCLSSLGDSPFLMHLLYAFFQEQLENAATESCSVKPEMILHDCQGKVTEVELWLQRVNLSLAESTQEPDMRQSLEQKLVDFQVRRTAVTIQSNPFHSVHSALVLPDAECAISHVINE